MSKNNLPILLVLVCLGFFLLLIISGAYQKGPEKYVPFTSKMCEYLCEPLAVHTFTPGNKYCWESGEFEDSRGFFVEGEDVCTCMTPTKGVQ
jgi:hypothetical protein